jgi:[ribosomal protein S5]-alanine N-acetyltransferase
MTEAVRAISRFAFSSLTLNRLEAACLPDNAPSIRLLLKTGFQSEGRARDYLSINGAWRDHLLFALLAKDVGAAGAMP